MVLFGLTKYEHLRKEMVLEGRGQRKPTIAVLDKFKVVMIDKRANSIICIDPRTLKKIIKCV